MLDKYSMAISGKNVRCLNKSYPLGKLFLDFMELDLTEYKKAHSKISSVLKNKDTDYMRNFTDKLSPPESFERGYEGFAYELLNISDKMTLEQKYVVYALYKALLLIEHPYLQILNYSAMSKLNSGELLDVFDLVKLQGKYIAVMEHCLIKNDSPSTAAERLANYEKGIEGKAELVFEISDDMTLYEVFTGSDISSFLYIEFMKMVQGNIFVSVCENCGGYFVPKGKYDMKYCDRIQMDNKSCQDIGAVKSFKNKLRTNPVYGEYEKAYKRFYARKRKGQITQEQFDAWLKTASKLKKEAQDGLLSKDDFIKRISKI